MNNDIIIIGAGAAGLMAAKTLAEAGMKPLILEARDRIGGRIFSFEKNGEAYEAGAEFIHGKLPVTLQLMKEAGLNTLPLYGEAWQLVDGKWTQENVFFAHAEQVLAIMRSLQYDMSIAEFLEEHFSDARYERLRKSLTGYVEGYYSGDIHTASTLSFAREFEQEDEEQFRPVGGYGKLLAYMEKCITKSGGQIELSCIVKTIEWEKGQVRVITSSGSMYQANRLLVTIPTGVWRNPESIAGIAFQPSLPAKTTAAAQLGFGAVIKILLHFDEPLLQMDAVQQQSNIKLGEVQFAITDLSIPTWWTQLPRASALLTGWLSGPQALAWKDATDNELLNHALSSLSTMLRLSEDVLRRKLQWHSIYNWTNDPFTQGSYSYSTLNTKQAINTMLEPVDATLYFAGEALYDGTEKGTVEAALVSGLDTASKIIGAK